MKEKESTPLLIWIAVITFCVGIPLCLGIDAYNTRVEAGDNFNEAFKVASIIFGVSLFCQIYLFLIFGHLCKQKWIEKMDANNLVFLLISIAIIAFNTYVFYSGYKDLQKRRQELREYKEQMLAELERFQAEAERLTKEAKG